MNSCVVLLLAVVGLAASSKSSSDGADGSRGNPISRIVTLLNGLKDKLETDLKAETDLFETYACWCKTTTSTKAASNDAATSRIDSLKTYIADIDAGRIEFTTEAQDLQKQIAGLKSDLETAKTMRDAEHKDFLAAKAEMGQAVSALDKAIKSIEEGTKGSLAQTRSYVDMLSTRHSIQKSMAFARALLGAEDQKYLEEFLSDDTPKPDWKKLNRKADHKMKYKHSSGKILSTLGGLRTTFQKNLDDAIQQEKDAKETYDKLSTSKNDMFDKASKAQKDMSLEGGARGVSKTDSQNEIDALTDQITADTKFISETEEAFKTKEKEFEGRKKLRGAETLAMSQAIAVLASDDAKDQFKSSFKSQGYNFLQEVATQDAPQIRAKCAARLVQSIASKSSDPRLALLAVQVGNAAIDKVVKKIDEIVAMKKTEEKEDLGKKQKCETDLSDAASKSRAVSLTIDGANEDIARASSQIAELKAQMKEQEEKKTGLHGQIKDIERQRKDENTLFKAAKLEDANAIDLVKSAINMLKDWKNAKKAALVSQHKKTTIAKKVAEPTPPEGIMPAPVAKAGSPAQAPHHLAAAAIKVHTAKHSSGKQAPQFQVDAGQAPPPPPATWGAGEEYGGAGEQKGIVGILELVMDDMKADIKSAETDETEALKDFSKTKTDLEGEIKACGTTIDALTKDQAEKEKTFSEKTVERSTKSGELEGQMKLYQAFKPGCDFLLVNFDLRTKARQIEIDGLSKAKAILKGGKFGKALIQETC